MKTFKTLCVCLSMALLLGGCHISEKMQLEPEESYEIAITDDYIVTLKLLSTTEEYVEVVVTKEETDGYFYADTDGSTNTDPILCDLVFVNKNEPELMDYVMVNDNVKAEDEFLGGGIVYGCPHAFFINNFEGSINLKFYFYHAQTEEYTVKMFTRDVLDYGIKKADAVKNDDGTFRSGDSIVRAIALRVE